MVSGSFILRADVAGTWNWLHPYLVPSSRMVELYLRSPTRLYGVVISYWSTGTTLHFYLLLYYGM
jgi:hypothetical protein